VSEAVIIEHSVVLSTHHVGGDFLIHRVKRHQNVVTCLELMRSSGKADLTKARQGIQLVIVVVHYQNETGTMHWRSIFNRVQHRIATNTMKCHQHSAGRAQVREPT